MTRIIKLIKKVGFKFIYLMLFFTVMLLLCSCDTGDIVVNNDNNNNNTSPDSMSSFSVPVDYDYYLSTTKVKDQSHTGTCWAYGSLSFIESECIRRGITDNSINLSEMYIIYHVYLEKAKRYLQTKSNSTFTEGGEDYDTFMVVDKYGIVRESDYKAKNKDYHAPVVYNMKDILDKVLVDYSEEETIPKEVIDDTLVDIQSLLDSYMGKVPEVVLIEDRELTPIEFAKDFLKIDVDNFVTITSFTHLPKYEYVELELPDNWQGFDRYINVELEELVNIAKNSIRMGYTISYGTDVSEPDVNWEKGYFIVVDEERIIDFEEMEAIRQEQFESGDTTDDHLMHIIGFDEDEHDVNDWFYVKNSWGDDWKHGGFVDVSEFYFKLKTIGITVNIDTLNGFEYIFPE